MLGLRDMCCASPCVPPLALSEQRQTSVACSRPCKIKAQLGCNGSTPPTAAIAGSIITCRSVDNESHYWTRVSWGVGLPSANSGTRRRHPRLIISSAADQMRWRSGSKTESRRSNRIELVVLTRWHGSCGRTMGEAFGEVGRRTGIIIRSSAFVADRTFETIIILVLNHWPYYPHVAAGPALLNRLNMLAARCHSGWRSCNSALCRCRCCCCAL